MVIQAEDVQRTITLDITRCNHYALLSILLKEETDFIEPQLLWNHTKSEILFYDV